MRKWNPSPRVSGFVTHDFLASDDILTRYPYIGYTTFQPTLILSKHLLRQVIASIPLNFQLGFFDNKALQRQFPPVAAFYVSSFFIHTTTLYTLNAVFFCPTRDSALDRARFRINDLRTDEKGKGPSYS